MTLKVTIHIPAVSKGYGCQCGRISEPVNKQCSNGEGNCRREAVPSRKGHDRYGELAGTLLYTDRSGEEAAAAFGKRRGNGKGKRPGCVNSSGRPDMVKESRGKDAYVGYLMNLKYIAESGGMDWGGRKKKLASWRPSMV